MSSAVLDINRPLFLVGFMCSGKTTLGRAFAKQLGIPFCDLDQLIESEQNMSVSEIFSTFGEERFRQIEAETINRVIGDAVPRIYALGGGTPCVKGTMDKLNDAGLTVHLTAPVERLMERIMLEEGKRPLVAGMTQPRLKSYVTSKLAERNRYYSQASVTFDASRLENEQQVAESVNRLIETLSKQLT